MSWFSRNKTGGYNNKPKVAVPGELVRFDQVVGYTENLDTGQYVVKTEEVVKYKPFSGMEDQKYGPVRKEVYGTGDLSDDRFSPNEKVRGPIEDSPWNNSPPSKVYHHTTRDDDDDDNVRVKYTRATRPNNLKQQEYYNDGKNKGNGFTKEATKPNYQEDYDETENPNTNLYSRYTTTSTTSTHPEKEKVNDYAARARTGPFGSPPGNETNYGAFNFKPMESSPPQFNAQPKQSGGIIDSKEAARKYNGILLAD